MPGGGGPGGIGNGGIPGGVGNGGGNGRAGNPPAPEKGIRKEGESMGCLLFCRFICLIF